MVFIVLGGDCCCGMNCGLLVFRWFTSCCLWLIWCVVARFANLMFVGVWVVVSFGGFGCVLLIVGDLVAGYCAYALMICCVLGVLIWLVGYCVTCGFLVGWWLPLVGRACA